MSTRWLVRSPSAGPTGPCTPPTWRDHVVAEREQQLAQRAVEVEAVARRGSSSRPGWPTRRGSTGQRSPSLDPERLVGHPLDVGSVQSEQRVGRRRLRLQPEPRQVRVPHVTVHGADATGQNDQRVAPPSWTESAVADRGHDLVDVPRRRTGARRAVLAPTPRRRGPRPATRPPERRRRTARARPRRSRGRRVPSTVRSKSSRATRDRATGIVGEVPRLPGARSGREVPAALGLGTRRPPRRGGGRRVRPSPSQQVWRSGPPVPGAWVKPPSSEAWTCSQAMVGVS